MASQQSQCVELEREFPNNAFEVARSEAKLRFDTSKCMEIVDFKESETFLSQNVHIPEINAFWYVEIWQSSYYSTAENFHRFRIVLHLKDENIFKDKFLFKAKFSMIASDPQIEFKNQIYSIDKETMTGPASGEFKFEKRCELHLSVTIHYVGEIHGTKHMKYVIPSPHNWILNPSHFGELHDTGELSDFTYVVRDRKFHVHKAILAAASPVFKNTFTCGLDETKSNTASIDEDPATFKAMLKFIYKGELPETFDKIALELFKLAHLYQIQVLQNICYGHIVDKEIDETNALKYYEFANEYDFKELSADCWTFIKFNLLHIFTPLEYENRFSVEEIRRILGAQTEVCRIKQELIDEKLARTTDKA